MEAQADALAIRRGSAGGVDVVGVEAHAEHDGVEVGVEDLAGVGVADREALSVRVVHSGRHFSGQVIWRIRSRVTQGGRLLGSRGTGGPRSPSSRVVHIVTSLASSGCSLMIATPARISEPTGPRTVALVDTLPLLGAGEVLKRELRERWARPRP